MLEFLAHLQKKKRDDTRFKSITIKALTLTKGAALEMAPLTPGPWEWEANQRTSRNEQAARLTNLTLALTRSLSLTLALTRNLSLRLRLRLSLALALRLTSRTRGQA